jgi:hypothetical protein
MSAIANDLWPDDIQTDEVRSPRAFLEEQARNLEIRTEKLLISEIVDNTNSGITTLSFEVFVPSIRLQVSLFTVKHRDGVNYPVSIIPPDEELPNFLKEEYTVKSKPFAVISDYDTTFGRKETVVKNEWIASSPIEFHDKLAKILKTSTIKARIISLIAIAKEKQSNSVDA